MGMSFILSVSPLITTFSFSSNNLTSLISKSQMGSSTEQLFHEEEVIIVSPAVLIPLIVFSPWLADLREKQW